jgi:hypothetical protein
MSREAEASECLQATDRQKESRHPLFGGGGRESEKNTALGLPVNAPSQEREQ